MGKKILSIPQIRALMKKGTPMIFGTDLLQSLYEYGQEALKITMEMNNNYHTPEEIRALFSELIARKVDKSCLILPPFYTEFGKNTKLGKRVFINTCCHFQDNGGIEIGDNTMLGSNVTIVTLNHDFAPEKRCNAIPKPVKIGKNVWIGANVTILPGVSIGDNSIIGAASVVTKDIPADTLAYGSPCRCIRKIC